jgi:GT2 family glycosyltransferase
MASMLSIIIITKDTEQLLKSLLLSIEKDTTLNPYIQDIIVIDNASADGTEVMIREEFPSLQYVKNNENKGFAASANMGIARAKGDYLLFLNSDTRLIDGEIVKMLHFMEEHKDVGICGPQLVFPDMRLQRSFAAAPSLLSELLPQLLRIPGHQSPVTNHHPPSTSHGIIDVSSLIGAAILVRKSLLKRFGGFDEQFFFFLEETDLCLRARSMGQRVVFLPDVKVIHLQGETVRKTWVKGRIEYNISLHKFIKKHHSLPYYLLFQWIRFIKTSIFIICTTCLPFLLFNKKIRRSYSYYARLLLWSVSGYPDSLGLRSNRSRK